VEGKKVCFLFFLAKQEKTNLDTYNSGCIYSKKIWHWKGDKTIRFPSLMFVPRGQIGLIGSDATKWDKSWLVSPPQGRVLFWEHHSIQLNNLHWWSRVLGFFPKLSFKMWVRPKAAFPSPYPLVSLPRYHQFILYRNVYTYTHSHHHIHTSVKCSVNTFLQVTHGGHLYQYIQIWVPTP